MLIEHDPPAVRDMERDAEFREDYGFGIGIDLPRYRAAPCGPWKLSRRIGGIASSYVAAVHMDTPYHVLMRDEALWMSTAMLERESHAWHLHMARGVVAVAGLGMGMYAAAATARDDVSQVIVAEIDPDVVEIWERSSDFASWPLERRQKLRIVVTDAWSEDFAKTVRSATGGKGPDYFYADIWEHYPAPEAAAATIAMVARLRPVASGWWGQEAAFAAWCQDTSQEMSIDLLRQYLPTIGVHTDVTDGYLAFCQDVAAAHGIDCPEKAEIGMPSL